MPEMVNGLWVQGELSPLELLTIQSFLTNGFSFQLWTYSPDGIHVPGGTIIRNAAEVIPYEEVLTYNNINIHGHGKGSYAGFSDIFRYKLLYEDGGIWTDMDITCLKKFELKEDYFFRHHHKVGAVGNFMKCPKQSMLMKWCYEVAVKNIDANNTNWMLPIYILNNGIQKFNLSTYIRKNSNNDSFPEVARLLSSKQDFPDSWEIIHWMNEEFRRLNINKDICLQDSQLNKLYIKYDIYHQTYKGFDIIKNKVLLSRYYYLWKNIMSTLNWHLSSHQKE